MAENNKQAPQNGDDDLVEWQGKFGGSVDGWWAPPEDKEIHVLKGVLVNFISKDRSDKLQSNSLIFELAEDCEGVKNGGSEKMPGQKADGKLYKAPKGCCIGVPEWKQLEGMWPAKAGHKVLITRSGEKRSIGKGRSMYDIKTKMTEKPVKHIEVFAEPDIDVGDVPAETQFQVEA